MEFKTIKGILREAKCPNPTGVAYAIKNHVLGLINEWEKKFSISLQWLKAKIQE